MFHKPNKKMTISEYVDFQARGRALDALADFYGDKYPEMTNFSSPDIPMPVELLIRKNRIDWTSAEGKRIASNIKEACDDMRSEAKYIEALLAIVSRDV